MNSLFVSIRRLLKFALSRPPIHGIGLVREALKVCDWFVIWEIPVPASSWLVGWLLWLL